MGLPRLKNFLRIQNYTDLQGTATCARYMATQSTVVHGCVCTSPSGHCNQVNQSREYQLNNVVARRMDDENYCYSRLFGLVFGNAFKFCKVKIIIIFRSPSKIKEAFQSGHF